MSDPPTFRARFRFRVIKPLNIKSHEHDVRVAGQEVVLSSRTPEVPICESQWLIANARGFETEAEARLFGAKLKAAAEFSSVGCRLGIDTGVNLATGRFGQSVKERVREEHGIIIHDDVHGVDVFPDDPNVRIPFFSGTGVVMQAPDPFLADLGELADTATGASNKTRDIVLLLNYALMRPEAVAQIVFAFSAVEMLGQQQKWSADQIAMLSKAADSVRELSMGTAEERAEVADAIQRGTHKFGLRQGVMRLLHAHGLGHLKKRWDDLYRERSTLIHGLAPQPGAGYDDLAHRAVSLCGHILLKVIAKDVPAADRHVDKFYPL